MAVLFNNKAISTLASNVEENATTITIQTEDAIKFPNPRNGDIVPLVIGNISEYEVVYGIVLDNNVYTVERAQEDTESVYWPQGTIIYNAITAGMLQTIVKQSSITKPHASTSDIYGQGTSTTFGHVRLTDEKDTISVADDGVGITSYAAEQAFNEVAGFQQQLLFTSSDTWIVPETGTYTIMCIGGGGKGGNGGIGYYNRVSRSVGYENTTYTNTSIVAAGGGGGGGGSAGEVKEQSFQLTAGESITLTVGAASGATSFGTYLTAAGGSAGANGSNGSVRVSGTCGGGPNQWQVETSNLVANGGSGGARGAIVGTESSTATNGSNGSSQAYNCVNNISLTAYGSGGVGGRGAVSSNGTYGNGGAGGRGGSCSIELRESNASGYSYGASGLAGTQGAIFIFLNT